MSNVTPMKVGMPCIAVAATATAAQTLLANAQAQFLLFYNAGSNPVFVNTGTATTSLVFPVAGTPQNGSIVAPGAIMTLEKNNSKDAYLITVCGAGLTTTLYCQTGNGGN